MKKESGIKVILIKALLDPVPRLKIYDENDNSFIIPFYKDKNTIIFTFNYFCISSPYILQCEYDYNNNLFTFNNQRWISKRHGGIDEFSIEVDVFHHVIQEMFYHYEGYDIKNTNIRQSVFKFDRKGVVIK